MSTQTHIYLDYHATTPVREEVLQAMLPYFSVKFGNASSKTHPFGWEAEIVVEQARKQIASVLSCESEEIIFTSGATESNNLALLGFALANVEKGNHLISCVTEHSSVLDPLKQLEKQGFEVTFLPVSSEGKISLEQLEKSIRPQTILISLMGANNEIGSLHPLQAIGDLAAKYGVAFHCDATQALGKVPLNVNAMNIHLLSLSGHKIYAPKGVGALMIRQQKIHPLLFGGGHERGLRSGTLNVPGIVALGEASRLAFSELVSQTQHLSQLRNDFFEKLQNEISDVFLNGSMQDRLCNNLNIRFHGVEAMKLMLECRSLAMSVGATCTSVKAKPSHVLQALGLNKEEVASSIRLSLGKYTTLQDLDFAVEVLKEGVAKIRSSSIEWQMQKETKR